MGFGILTTQAVAQVGRQDRTVSGVVVTAFGETLPGAAIVVDGTTIGVVSDIDGAFTLKVPADRKSITVSLLGMTPQTVVLGTADSYRVVLQEESFELNEVVAIGYGSVQKRDISGSITNVTGEKFNKGVVTSAEQMIKGQVAGLVVTSPGGDPTASATIRLRGTTSLVGGNGPLIVVDGIPGIYLNSVAPQDIESVSVLKDASAAAIYGARSANGVIMITTKKGKAGKATLSYDGYFGVENLTRTLDMLTADDWRKYVKDRNITDAMDYGANTNWVKELYRTGYSQNHNLSITGGTENSTYRASVNYLDQKGIAIANEQQRLSTNVAFDQKALDGKLRLLLNANATIEDFGKVPTSSVFTYAPNLNPTLPVYDKDGKYMEVLSNYEYYNPVALLHQLISDEKRNYFTGRMQLEYKITDALTATVNGAMERSDLLSGFYGSRESPAYLTVKGYARRSVNEYNSKLFESMLSYNKTFGRHKVNAIAGYSWQEFIWEDFSAQNRTFVTDLFTYNSLGSGNGLLPTDVSSYKQSNKLISFYARANYAYADKYIFTGTLRRDGSTKFGKDNKWGIFPSGSLAWRVSQESFMENKSWVDDLKIRLSYGITGNQDIPNYKASALYGSSGFYYQAGEFHTQYAPNQNENPNLKWEETAQLDFGIDYFLFGGKLRGSIDYYNKRTSNLLYDYPVPSPPYQYGNMMANVGEVENRGIELSVESTIVDRKDFSWDLGFNFAKNKNKVIALSNDQFNLDIVYLGEWSLNGLRETTEILKAGLPLGTFYGAKYIGKDENGIFQYDGGEDGNFVYSDDRQIIGCALPDFTVNMTNAFSYRNLSLSFMLRGVFGNDIVNSTALYLEDINRMPGNNVLKAALDKPAQSLVYSSYYIEDGSFVRMEYLTLGYDFKLKPDAKIRNLRLTATANNLFVITGYSGIDPEINADGLVFGIDARNYYPKTRSFSLGLNISF
ncbi:MAG: TonB-dependent receptor [Tannerella sp.]|nr:TonB-dependent receptor [Tannerella sp.]